MPLSNMPPHHTGMPCCSQKSWMAMDGPYPPTRPGLMLMIRPLPNVCMSIARSSDVIDSSRQTGVSNDVIPGERLLDHHQVERVELREAIDVVQRVGVVGVGHERR